jgi:hypothetical protein
MPNARKTSTIQTFVVLDGIFSQFSLVKRQKEIGLEFLIDKLTHSIENAVSGDSFATEISLVSFYDLKLITKSKGWVFNWRQEFNEPARDVFKLTIVNNPSIIQGLISLEVKIDHVFMHLVESAPYNKGKNKVYTGVPGNLVAYACKLAFQRGHQGNVSFISKSELIQYYIKTLGAIHFGGRLMIIETQAALKLIDKYF